MAGFFGNVGKSGVTASVGGSTNTKITQKEYTGASTDTAITSVNKQSNTVTTLVKKVPNKLDITIDGKKVSYDGSENVAIEITSAGQTSEIEGQINDLSNKLSDIEETLEEQQNTLETQENALSNKQDKLTAGGGIKIEDNTISQAVETEYSVSLTAPYSADYTNKHFVPMTFAQRLYFTTDVTGIKLLTQTPTVKDSNKITSTIANLTMNWDTPLFTLTRQLGSDISLNSTSSFNVNLYFTSSVASEITFGAKVYASTDGGLHYSVVSNQQIYQTKAYHGLGIEDLVVYTDLLNEQIFSEKDIFKIEIFAYASIPTTFILYCGAELDGAPVYSFAEFNFKSININTNQIEDGAVTRSKLSSQLQRQLSLIQADLDSVETAPTKDSLNLITSGAVYDVKSNLENTINNVVNTSVEELRSDLDDLSTQTTQDLSDLKTEINENIGTAIDAMQDNITQSITPSIDKLKEEVEDIEGHYTEAFPTEVWEENVNQFYILNNNEFIPATTYDENTVYFKKQQGLLNRVQTIQAAADLFETEMIQKDWDDVTDNYFKYYHKRKESFEERYKHRELALDSRPWIEDTVKRYNDAMTETDTTFYNNTHYYKIDNRLVNSTNYRNYFVLDEATTTMVTPSSYNSEVDYYKLRSEYTYNRVNKNIVNSTNYSNFYHFDGVSYEGNGIYVKATSANSDYTYYEQEKSKLLLDYEDVMEKVPQVALNTKYWIIHQYNYILYDLLLVRDILSDMKDLEEFTLWKTQIEEHLANTPSSLEFLFEEGYLDVLKANMDEAYGKAKKAHNYELDEEVSFHYIVLSDIIDTEIMETADTLLRSDMELLNKALKFDCYICFEGDEHVETIEVYSDDTYTGTLIPLNAYNEAILSEGETCYFKIVPQTGYKLSKTSYAEEHDKKTIIFSEDTANAAYIEDILDCTRVYLKTVTEDTVEVTEE